MSTQQQSIEVFTSGTHNMLPNEVIPQDAASDSLSWTTNDGRIELTYGRQAIGGQGAAGKNYGEHIGYQANGTAVHFRKVNTKIQVLVGSSWTDVITGLTEEADYTFANYQSLAGAFVYIFGIDGIYKIATANPTSYTSLYDATINFKGFGIIDKGRTILWGRAEDPTGLYGSWIDTQVAVSGGTGVYTTVSGEATTSLTGTLAFKAGGATRTCFGVTITITASGEVYTDNFNGVLTGSLGGTGTINYTSGAYTVSNAGVGTVSYQWENSNLRGVTDFRKAATRVAGEGFVIRQDSGGDAIQSVLVLDGNYFSIKKNSCYRFYIGASDTLSDGTSINEIFRVDIGVPSLRSAVATGQGIIFMNTANPSKPRVGIIQRNPLGDNFDAVELFPQFNFALYSFSDCLLDSWDKYIIIGCKYDSLENNRLLLCDVINKTVDATYYGIRTSAKSTGYLYGGDPVSQTTYEMFTGFDDVGTSITNYWDSKGEVYGSDVLKKTRRLRIKGKISPDQNIEVYLLLDNNSPYLVGTILGSGDYVDYGTSFAIGTALVGSDTVGGGDVTNVYQYYIELRLKTQKFRKRIIRLVAGGIGYASVDRITDFDILTYSDKMPSKYRSKQNVSLDGETTDMANPEF